ncbi:hypothetical protein QFZ78_002799 [Paenibacillus sp. V4I5]|nr:hypothetical protein [Paenibacillus sp. V4I5]
MIVKMYVNEDPQYVAVGPLFLVIKIVSGK